MKRLYVVALALLLSACGGDPPPPVAPPGQSPSSSASGTAAPVMPEVAETDSITGATAFLKHYIGLINHAQSTGDTSTLAKVEDPQCVSCANGRTAIRKLYSKGGRLEGGALDFSFKTGRFDKGRQRWDLEVLLRWKPQVVVQPTALPSTNELEGGTVRATFGIERRGSGWAVADWKRHG